MNMSFPVAALAVLGIIIAVLGLFAAGNIAVTVVGLVAVAVAGLLEILGRSRGPQSTDQPDR
jgi:hypothetical protein